MNDTLPPDADPHSERNLACRPEFDCDRPPASLDSDEAALQRQSSPLSAYLHALRRRWFLASSLGFICAVCAAAAVWLLNGGRYTAMTQFRVAASLEARVFDDRGAIRRDDFEIYKKSQEQYVKSDYVLIAALRNEEIKSLPIVRQQNDPVRWLAENVKVAFPGDAEIMIIGLTTDSPESAALLAASVAKAYLDDVVNQERTRQTSHYQDIQSELTKKKAALEDTRARLQVLIKELGPVDPQALSNEQRFAQEAWQAMRRELITAQNEVGRLTAELQQKQAQLQLSSEASGDAALAVVTDLELESELARDLIYGDLRGRHQNTQEQIDNILELGKANGQSQLLQQHREDLTKIRQQMDDRRTEIVAELRRHKLILLAGDVSKLEAEMTAKKAYLERCIQDEGKYRREVKDRSESSVVVEGLQRDIDALQNDIIKPMERQAYELQVELGRPSRVTLDTRVDTELTDQANPKDTLTIQRLAKAIRPRSPDASRRMQKAAGGGMAAFLLAVGVVLYFEVRSRRVNSSLDVSQTLGLPVIGAIPLIPLAAITRAGGNSARYRRWRTLLSESMRNVMVRLLHEAQSGQSQVVMVSSAAAGEGKSTIATNLAVATARAGYRTLLVDFDLRRPTLGELFDLPASPGVSEILRHESELDDCINNAYTDDLWVLTSGRWSPYHVSVLANGDTELLFSELRERYQFIIVDGSPILGVAESQLLCRHADTVLLSVLRDVSSGPKILAACETLAAFGVRSLYAVVTGAANSDYGYYYGGYAYSHEEADA